MNGRHALVIGANAYHDAALANAVDDARRVAAALRERGFSTSIALDPDQAAIDVALADFKLSAQTAELALIYLAGHAVERHGSGFFLPVDSEFPVTAARLRFTATCFNAFVEATNGAGSRIIVLDACRNWPHDPDEVRRTLNDLEELAADERDWPNLLLAYATSSTRTAGDGGKDQGSVFSSSLCRQLLDHDLTVDECFRRVSQDVVAHRHEQQPWTYSSLARTLSFTERTSGTSGLPGTRPSPMCRDSWPGDSGLGISVSRRQIVVLRRSRRRRCRRRSVSETVRDEDVTVIGAQLRRRSARRSVEDADLTIVVSVADRRPRPWQATHTPRRALLGRHARWFVLATGVESPCGGTTAR